MVKITISGVHRTQMDTPQKDITPNVFYKVNQALSEYENEMKIDAISATYDIITNTEITLLNEKLRQLINSKQ